MERVGVDENVVEHGFEVFSLDVPLQMAGFALFLEQVELVKLFPLIPTHNALAIQHLAREEYFFSSLDSKQCQNFLT